MLAVLFDVSALTVLYVALFAGISAAVSLAGVLGMIWLLAWGRR